MRLWASPWTPPTWMKTNSGTVNGASCARRGATPFDGGCMQDNARSCTALALYLVKWVQAYAAQKIKIEAIHHQNEPGYAPGIRRASGRRRSTPSSSGPTWARRSPARAHRADHPGHDVEQRLGQGRHHRQHRRRRRDGVEVHQGLRDAVEHAARRLDVDLEEPADPPDRAQVRQLPLGHRQLSLGQRRPTITPTRWRAGA